MEHFIPPLRMQGLSLLLSSTDEIEVHVIRGLLEVKNINVTVMADGVGLVTGERDGIYSKYSIYVSECDFNTARNILRQSEEYPVVSDIEVNTGVLGKHRIILKILLLITAIFFAVFAYFAMMAHEVAMGYVLGGASIFFLLVLFFSFDRSALG